MVTVKVSETYDLSTKVGKMGIVGIHTPIGTLVERMWSGLVRQYDKFRFVSCDVAMACASMLPADPLQVGVEAGAIAPQDMFNPILYKAVSNDSMNTFLQFIQGCGFRTGNSDGMNINKDSIVGVNSAVFKSSSDSDATEVDQMQMYYGLLSDPKGWRKSMPQQGLSMRGLKPLVYNVVNAYGLNQAGGPLITGAPSDNMYGLGFVGGDLGTLNTADPNDPGFNFPTSFAGSNPVYDRQGVGEYRGRALPMPFVNTKFYPTTDTYGNGSVVTETESVNKDSQLQCNVGRVPPAYVGLIILPPAVLNQLYYRIKVTWTVEFKGLMSNLAVSNWNGVAKFGALSYSTDYAIASSSLAEQTTAMVDTAGSDIDKIMEGA
nr:MAG: capsid protein [Smacoviridae sp.]